MHSELSRSQALLNKKNPNLDKAVGNILGSFYGGNKTFLRKNITIQNEVKENPAWTLLTSQKFKIQDYEILKTVSSLNELPASSESEKNQQQQINRPRIWNKKTGKSINKPLQINFR